MSWNYRIARYESDGESGYSVVEAYYNTENEIFAVSEPIAPYGETPEDLRLSMERMLMAFERPVIEPDTMTFGTLSDEGVKVLDVAELAARSQPHD